MRSSSCAMEDIMAKRSSESSSKVLMLSFWKKTPTPARKSCLVYWMESSVFRANREISLVMTRSNIPASASSTMRLKFSRRLVEMPDRPSSMYPGTKVQAAFFRMSSS